MSILLDTLAEKQTYQCVSLLLGPPTSATQYEQNKLTYVPDQIFIQRHIEGKDETSKDHRGPMYENFIFIVTFFSVYFVLSLCVLQVKIRY